MEYSKLVELYEYLEKTPSRLKKIDAVAGMLSGADEDHVVMLARLLQGRVFPSWSEEDFGIASLLMMRIIQTSTGHPMQDVEKLFKETGDLGIVAEKLISTKKQTTLFSSPLSVRKVFENLRKLSSVTGKGSQERKFHIVAELISSAKPKEAKYIVRTVLGELRVGVADGVIRDAIAKAFLGKEEPKEAVKAVEWAWFLLPDYGEIARVAKTSGMEGLRKISLEIGKPYRVLLAEKAPSLQDALNSFENPVIEFKYDGMRAQIHKDGEKVWVYTRRLEDVTRQFPDIVEMVRDNVKARKCIIEGEAVGMDKRTGNPLPFQFLSQRIQRKYGIERMVEEIPVQVNLFDIVLLEGETLFGKPLRERRTLLQSVIREVPERFQLARGIITKDFRKAQKFYEEALRHRQEGVMVKNLDATYQPGRRVAGGWLKVKPVMENLDLVIIGAVWGTGKRAGWMSSFVLGCRDEDGNFLECGMMGTGIKEKDESGITFESLTKLLKPHIEREEGNRVILKPKIVAEVAYEEIQKSPNYSSGYALRFPRIVRLRPDRSPEDADTLERIERLYEQQKGRGDK